MKKSFVLSQVLLGLLAISGQTMAFVTVGQSGDCDYNNLEDAYLSADPFVRVTSEAAFTDVFTITKAKWFTGGYDTCADAENGDLGTNKSKWRRLNGGTVIKIDANQAAQSIVVIDNFEVFGGENLSNGEAGGIKVTGKSSLLLSHSEVYDNVGIDGGGIHVSGGDAIAILTAVKVRDNIGNSFGGGIYCSDQATVTVLGESSINNNLALAGGGIFATSECDVSSNSGDTLPALQSTTGIRSNEARYGGGVYLTAGATLKLEGNDDHPASVIFNLANEDGGDGGGIYLEGQGTRLTGINARIDANIAQSFGAGFEAADFAVVNLSRLDSPCWDDVSCSSLSYNILLGAEGEGGAADIYDAAVASISQTHISNNKANLAAIFNVDNASYLRLEGNLLVDNRHWTDDSNTTLMNLVGPVGDGANLDFFYNTLSDNLANSVIYLENETQNTLSIHNSIIQHQGDTLDQDGNTNNVIQVDCVFLTEQNSLTGNIGTVLLSDPGLVGNGDYALSANSDAIDLCDEQAFVGSNYSDITGTARGYDDPQVNNFLGPYDAGAFEYNNDVIFTNGFD